MTFSNDKNHFSRFKNRIDEKVETQLVKFYLYWKVLFELSENTFKLLCVARIKAVLDEIITHYMLSWVENRSEEVEIKNWELTLKIKARIRHTLCLSCDMVMGANRLCSCNSSTYHKRTINAGTWHCRSEPLIWLRIDLFVSLVDIVSWIAKEMKWISHEEIIQTAIQLVN